MRVQECQNALNFDETLFSNTFLPSYGLDFFIRPMSNLESLYFLKSFVLEKLAIPFLRSNRGIPKNPKVFISWPQLEFQTRFPPKKLTLVFSSRSPPKVFLLLLAYGIESL